MNFEWDLQTIFILFGVINLIQLLAFVIFTFNLTKNITELQDKVDELDEWINDLYDTVEQLECTVETLKGRPQEVTVRIQKEVNHEHGVLR